MKYIWSGKKSLRGGSNPSLNKAVWLKRVNVALFLLLVLQAVTALLAGVIGKKWFEVFHPIGGFLLVLAALIHLGLNWTWVRTVVLKRKA